jgi:hypothetical protein
MRSAFTRACNGAEPPGADPPTQRLSEGRNLSAEPSPRHLAAPFMPMPFGLCHG